MVHGENRIPYRIDRRLTGLAGPDYDAIISFGLPIEPEDSQYGKSWLGMFRTCAQAVYEAKIHYLRADGCAVCSPECHTS